MNNNKIENIVNDLLYEASARKTIKKSQSKVIKLNVKILSAIAAGFLLMSSVYFLLKTEQVNSYQDYAIEAYEFPLISKTRSAESSIVDDYLTEVNAQKFDAVLPKLSGNQLSNKDLFVKSNILFANGQLQECRKLLDSVNWQDTEYIDDTNWLKFLLAYSDSEDKLSLQEKLGNLNSKHQRQAMILMSKRD